MNKKNNFLEEDIGKRLEKVRATNKKHEDSMGIRGYISIIVSVILVVGILISVISALF